MKLLTAEKKRLKKLKQFDAVTLDGHTIKLFANIALPEDVKDVHRAGADGVGLFRTEFLFMNRDDLPCEDEQYNAYCRVIRSMKGQPVVIRTADLGGDKVMSQDALEKLTTGPLEELNPSLGLRGLRFCFAHPKLFVTQLRAILRAAATGRAMSESCCRWSHRPRTSAGCANSSRWPAANLPPKARSSPPTFRSVEWSRFPPPS